MSSEQSYTKRIHDIFVDADFVSTGPLHAPCVGIAAQADADLAALREQLEAAEKRNAELQGLADNAESWASEATSLRQQLNNAGSAIQEHQSRIRELEDNDAIGKRLTDGHLARIAELEAVVGTPLMPVQWSLPPSVDDDPWEPSVHLVISPFYEGQKYAVRNQLGRCLNKAGEWEYEPIPSSRDDAFYARCRFNTFADAREAALAARREDTCPGCGGEPDNGYSRDVPPSPYYCSRCEAPR